MLWSWGRGNAQDKVTARSLEATKRRTAGVGEELAKMSDESWKRLPDFQVPGLMVPGGLRLSQSQRALGGGGDCVAVVPTVAVAKKRGICGRRWGVVSRKKNPSPFHFS